MLKKIAIQACCLFLAVMAVTIISGELKAQDTPVSASDLISGKPQQLPVKGMVTMVEIGAHSCIPCKMMMPIIKEVSKEYEGRAAIAFIDVWEHREEASRYGISAIPTQIFYDAEGKERYRHVGFLEKKTLIAKLTELGVK